ncbi:MAG: GreA/GreB family elongation factor [Bdellovibrionota bacterium]
MDKQILLQSVVSLIEAELQNARAAASSAREAATAEENRPENQYDTRALEASFLARGQAARVAELEHSIKVLREFPLKPLCDEDPVQTGAIVRVDCDGCEQIHFVLPSGAGLQVNQGKQKISVVTTSSPLGTELLGKSVGDSFVFKRGGASKEFEVISVA